MNLLKDFLNFIGINVEEENPIYTRKDSMKDPLILSLRNFPRDEMEEPEVEYISIPVENNNNNINEVINAEILS